MSCVKVARVAWSYRNCITELCDLLSDSLLAPTGALYVIVSLFQCFFEWFLLWVLQKFFQWIFHGSSCHILSVGVNPVSYCVMQNLGELERIPGDRRWNLLKVASLITCSICKANICLTWQGLTPTFCGRTLEWVHSKGRKWNPISGLHLPAQVRVPAESRKEAGAHFCRKEIARMQLLQHFNGETCPSVQNDHISLLTNFNHFKTHQYVSKTYKYVLSGLGQQGV